MFRRLFALALKGSRKRLAPMWLGRRGRGDAQGSEPTSDERKAPTRPAGRAPARAVPGPAKARGRGAKKRAGNSIDIYKDDAGDIEEIDREGEDFERSADEAARLDQRWALYMVPKVDGSCWAPWQALKVDVFDRTMICCSYFERLPEFDWPSAREFHDEKRMWNHPFMQHMRSTMGREDEVPFCSFCQGRYGKDLPLKEAKRAAMRESQVLYQAVLEANADFEFRGSIKSLPDELNDWSFTAPGRGQVPVRKRPFRRSRSQYRRNIRMRGFWNVGHVLQMGCDLKNPAPFLAEANPAFTIVDTRMPRLKVTEHLLKALNLGESEVRQIETPCALPFADGLFDAVWLDGGWLRAFGRTDVLREVRRVLKTNGRLHVRNVPGVGHLIDDVLNEVPDFEPSAVIEILARGAEYGGIGSFVTEQSLTNILRDAGFTVDKARPPHAGKHGGKYREHPALGRDPKAIAALLTDADFRAAVKEDPARLDGLEQHLTFSALAAERKPIAPKGKGRRDMIVPETGIVPETVLPELRPV